MELAIQITQFLIFAGFALCWYSRVSNLPKKSRGSFMNVMEAELKGVQVPFPVAIVFELLKMAAAVMLFLGLWFPSFTGPSGIVMSVLLLLALARHLRENSRFEYATLLLFGMSLFVAVFSFIFPTSSVM